MFRGPAPPVAIQRRHPAALAVHRCEAAARPATSRRKTSVRSRRRRVPPRLPSGPRRPGSRPCVYLPCASAGPGRGGRRSAGRFVGRRGPPSQRPLARSDANNGICYKLSARVCRFASCGARRRGFGIPVAGVCHGKSSGRAIFGPSSMGRPCSSRADRGRSTGRNRWQYGPPPAGRPVSRGGGDRRARLSRAASPSPAPTSARSRT